MTNPMPPEALEQTARDIEATWTEFVDEQVIDVAEVAVMSVRILAHEVRKMRGMPFVTDGHVRFKAEDSEDVWCHESCPMPDDICGDLTTQAVA